MTIPLDKWNGIQIYILLMCRLNLLINCLSKSFSKQLKIKVKILNKF